MPERLYSITSCQGVCGKGFDLVAVPEIYLYVDYPDTGLKILRTTAWEPRINITIRA